MDFITGAIHHFISVRILGLRHIWWEVFRDTQLCFGPLPWREVATSPWPRDPRTGSANALLESPEVKGSIFLEMARNTSTPYVIFQFGADDRKKRHTQKLKEKQIQNRCQEILCSPEEEKNRWEEYLNEAVYWNGRPEWGQGCGWGRQTLVLERDAWPCRAEDEPGVHEPQHPRHAAPRALSLLGGVKSCAQVLVRRQERRVSGKQICPTDVDGGAFR